MLAVDAANSLKIKDLCRDLEAGALTVFHNSDDDEVCQSLCNLRYALGVFCMHEGDTTDEGVAELLSHAAEALVSIDVAIAVDKVRDPVAKNALLDVSRKASVIIALYATSDLDIEEGE